MSPRGQGRRSALQQALALLTRREHSRCELSAKLRTRGYPADEIDAAIAHLIEGDWQSDARFAESLIRHRAASGYGPRWIRAELATHQLDHALIESALGRFDGDWSQIARDLLRRRHLLQPEDDTQAYQRKALDLLLRRGFSRDDALID